MAKTMTKDLTKAQIRKYRALLEEKREEIRQNLRSAAASKALARGDDSSNLEDLPTQSHEEWIFLNRNSIDVMLLREIGDALGRMEEGSYGTCMECDEAISQKRLDAIAWARYCVPCQELLASYES